MKKSLKLIFFLLLIGCDFNDSDRYSKTQEISITNAEGDKTSFIVPLGFRGTTVTRALDIPKGQDFIIHMWWDGEYLKPYWPERKKLEARNLSDVAYYAADRRAKIVVDIIPGLPKSLETIIENSVLPKEMERNFDVVFGGLYWLGRSTKGDRQNPGRRFYHHPQIGLTESKSVDQWYVPVDEVNMPGFHVNCTNHPSTPDDAGFCTIKRKLTCHSFIRYHFFKGHLFEWRRLDRKVLELFSSLIVAQPSAKKIGECYAADHSG